MQNARQRSTGFTLIELMVTVVIVAILAAVALPSYTHYIVRGQRAAARAALLQTSQAMERYYTANGNYSPAGTALPLTLLAGSTCVAASPNDGNPSYCVSGAITATGYLLTATACGAGGVTCPAGAKTGFTDPDCPPLTLDNTGAQGPAGAPAECWQK